MPQIKVFTDNNKNYTVTAEGDVIGELAYKNWYSNKAEVIMATEEHYIIENKNFWGTQQEVKQEGAAVLLLKARWDGGIAIILPKDKEHYYEFKPKGYFTNAYILTNYKEEELLILTPDFSWKKFMAGYTINCNGNFGTTSLDKLLLMICIYHYKVTQAMQMAAATN